MQVTISNQIVIENPTPALINWCKDNLILANPEYSKKARMGFYVGKTPKTIQLYEKHGSNLVLPYGTLKEILPLLDKHSIQSKFHSYANVYYGDNPVPLYDYQEKAVTQMINAKYGILQSSPGSGKTQMAISLIQRLGKRALWLTHTHDLLIQSKERAEQYLDKSILGTITEGKVSIGLGVTFATVQTMCNIDLELYRNFWDVIVVDECHRVAGSPTSITQFSKVLNNLSARHKYGLSATVHRADGLIKSTYALLGQVAYVVPDSEIADKIMKVGIVPVSTKVGVSRECQNTDGTINYAKLLTYLCNHQDRNYIINYYLMQNIGKSCLVLSNRLDHLEKMMDNLPAFMKKDAVMISGKMTTKKAKEERRQALEDMRTGKKKYLFATYNLCKEGLDIPRLERLFLTTPNKDSAVISQSVGRVARTFEGKDNPLVYDFVDDGIGFLVKTYKKRCTTYRKDGCYFVEE